MRDEALLGTVSELWRYPASSLAGERLDAISIEVEGIAGDRALNQADGLHPTAEGVKVIVRTILPTVERFILSLSPRT